MARIVIQLETCLHAASQCSRCMDECPMQLLDRELFVGQTEQVIEDEMCIECRNCEVTCPVNAIKAISVDFS